MCFACFIVNYAVLTTVQKTSGREENKLAQMSMMIPDDYRCEIVLVSYDLADLILPVV